MLGFGSHQDQKEAMFKSKVDTTLLNIGISRSSGDIARFNANMDKDYSHKVEMEDFLQTQPEMAQVDEYRTRNSALNEPIVAKKNNRLIDFMDKLGNKNLLDSSVEEEKEESKAQFPHSDDSSNDE